jgi:hypothetical protein
MNESTNSWFLKKGIKMKAKCLLIGVVVLFIAGVLTASSFAELDPETCIGVWLFDEDEGDIAADSSKEGNDGQLVGNPAWVEGKFGSALEFVGANKYVDCGDEESLSITKTITVQAWVEFEGSPSSAIVISKYGVSGSGLSYMLVINGDGGASGKASFYLSGWRHFSTQINDGDWHHLAATVNSEGIDLYVDGELDIHYAGVPTISVSNSTVTIGAPNSNNWGTSFSGVIDDVAIFDVALEKEDILTLMNQGLEESLYPSAVDVSGKLTTTWANIKAR